MGRLIPASMVAVMARVEEANMDHTARIFRPRTGGPGPGGMTTPRAALALDPVPCRLSQVGGSTPQNGQATQATEAAAWRVSFPRGTDVAPGDLLWITGAAGGRAFAHALDVTVVDDAATFEARRRVFAYLSGPLATRDPRAGLATMDPGDPAPVVQAAAIVLSAAAATLDAPAPMAAAITLDPTTATLEAV